MKSISKWLGFKKYFYFAVKNKSKEKTNTQHVQNQRSKNSKKTLKEETVLKVSVLLPYPQ